MSAPSCLRRGLSFLLVQAFLVLGCCLFLPAQGLAEDAAAKEGQKKPQAKVLPTPLESNSTAKTVVNGVETSEPPLDPKAAAIEDRVMRYKFILESLGFALEEIIISPDFDYDVELIFLGRLNAPLEKLHELTAKFQDEEKLMAMLRTIYDYNNRDLTNYGAAKVVLRLSEPVDIRVHYRKF